MNASWWTIWIWMALLLARRGIIPLILLFLAKELTSWLKGNSNINRFLDYCSNIDDRYRLEEGNECLIDAGDNLLPTIATCPATTGIASTGPVTTGKISRIWSLSFTFSNILHGKQIILWLLSFYYVILFYPVSLHFPKSLLPTALPTYLMILFNYFKMIKLTFLRCCHHWHYWNHGINHWHPNFHHWCPNHYLHYLNIFINHNF